MAGRSSSYASSERSSKLSSWPRRLVSWSMPGCRHGRAATAAAAKSEGSRLPAIMITGQGDVPMAARSRGPGGLRISSEKPVGRGETVRQHRARFGTQPGIRPSCRVLREAAANAPRRSDPRAQRQIMELCARRSPQQEHCRRPRNQPAHGRESSRRRHERDRLALAFGADPLGARRGRVPRRNLSADRQRDANWLRHSSRDRVSDPRSQAPKTLM